MCVCVCVCVCERELFGVVMSCRVSAWRCSVVRVQTAKRIALQKKRRRRIDVRSGGLASSTSARQNHSEADAILVLAGGQMQNGDVPVWVKARLADAVKVFTQQCASGSIPPAMVMLGSGSPHAMPVMNAHNRVLHEAASCAKILMRDHDIDPQYIYKETCSYDTIGNAYFALVQHCMPRRWKRLVVVTSNFHLARTRAVFEWVFNVRDAGGPYTFEFIGASDAGLESTAADARAERERASLEDLREKTERITTLADMHEFINQEHSAYSAADQDDFGKPGELNDDVRRSYASESDHNHDSIT